MLSGKKTIGLFRLLFIIGLTAVANISRAQALMHSHNDYDHARPFWGAFKEKAGSVEADVFPEHGRLMVAHAKEQVVPGHTLYDMYIGPIIGLFRKHHHKTVSDDPGYTFYLMIDIKEKWDSVLPLLIKRLERHPACFNRAVNPMAVQVFISGDRPPDTTFHRYPPTIMFDGLPGKRYAPADRKKIAMISTDFHLYSRWDGTGKLPAEEAKKIKQVIAEARHPATGESKPVRFWGAPDTRDCWKTLVSLGADVINTDHVSACRKFLQAVNH